MNEPTPDHIPQAGVGFWASKTLLSAVERTVHRHGNDHPVIALLADKSFIMSLLVPTAHPARFLGQ